MISTPPTGWSPILPKAECTTKNPPGAHSYTSLVTMGTDGIWPDPIVWPSLIQLPISTARASWRWSRAGAAWSVAATPAATATTRADLAVSDIGLLRGAIGDGPQPQTGRRRIIHRSRWGG